MQKVLNGFGRFYQVFLITLFTAGALIVPVSAGATVPLDGTCYTDPVYSLFYLNPNNQASDVLNLQKVLNNDPATQIALSSSGSPGLETTTFGSLTEIAVQKFQTKYNIVISGTPSTTGYGKVGPQTRAKLTELYGCASGIQAIIVNTPGRAVEMGSTYTIRWATTTRPLLVNGVNIRILKNGTLVPGQEFGRPSGNLSYDYNNDGTVDKNDVDFLIEVSLGNQGCPIGKICKISEGLVASASYDYNNDGVISGLDNDLLRIWISGTSVCPINKICDINGDGRISGADLTKFLNYTDINVGETQLMANLVLQYTSLPDNGSFLWNVPTNLVSGADYQIKIIAENDTNTFGISGQFSVVPSISKVSIPSACIEESDCIISWTKSGSIPNVSIVLFDNLLNPIGNGGFIANSIPNTGSFTWRIGSQPFVVPPGSYKVAVFDPTRLDGVGDYSNIFTINPAQRDVSVVSTTISPSNPKYIVGDKIIFSGKIKNTGSATLSSFAVNFCLNLSNFQCSGGVLGSSGILESFTVSTLNSGEEKILTMSAPWTSILGSNYKIVVCADTKNQIAETDELNNCKGINFSVDAPPPISTRISVNQALPIPYNTNATLMWSSTGATSCTASDGGDTSWEKPTSNKALNNLSPGETVGPLKTTMTFSLVCSGLAGNDLDSVTVTVQPPPAVSLSFSAVPSSVPSGSPSILTWSAQNATSCTASGGWSGTKATTGTESTGSIAVDKSYTLSCTGSGGTTQQAVNVTIIPTLAIVTPSGGAQLEQGKSFNITWTTTGSTGDNFKVTVLRNGEAVIGQSFTTTTATNPRNFVWSIPATLTAGSGYVVLVEAISNSAVQDTSDGFNIIPPPKIKVSSPNGGEIWNIGSVVSPRNITWESAGLAGTNVNINLKRKTGIKGQPDIIVGSLTPNGTSNNQGNIISPQKNTFQWKLEEDWLVAGTGYIIQVCSRDIQTLCDESDISFIILNEPIQLQINNVIVPTLQPLIIGQTNATYSVIFTNKGIRSVSGVSLSAWIEQGTSKTAPTITGVECQAQLSGIVLPGLCSSVGANQTIFVSEESGAFVDGKATLKVELLVGGSSLNPKVQSSFPVELTVPPGVFVVTPNGGEILEMGGQLVDEKNSIRNPYHITWKFQGQVNAVDISLKRIPATQNICESQCDVNGDNVINSIDQNLFNEFKRYDINGDRRVDQTDNDVLLRVIGNFTSCPNITSCDLNEDNIVSGSDGLRFTNYLSNLYDINDDGVWTDADAQLLINFILNDCPQTRICNLSMDSFFGGGDVTVLTNVVGLGGYSKPSFRYDFNNDGVADTKDRTILEQAAKVVGSCPIFSSSNKTCDLDGNGVVDSGDVQIIDNFLNYFSSQPTGEGVIMQNVRALDKKLDWSVNNNFVTIGDNFKIVVCDSARPDVCDESNKPFSIVVSAPTIKPPIANESFDIEPKLKININATVPGRPGLTRYRIRIIQNKIVLYESSINSLDTLPFVFDKSLLRARDGKPIIEFLRQGDLTIMMEANFLDMNGRVTDFFTPPALRTVQLKFNRTAPIIENPKEKQEINLTGGILITATHPSTPSSYRVSLYQNGALKYLANTTSGPSGLYLNLDKNTEYQGMNVFRSLDKGEVLLVVQGALFEGYTNEASRVFTVIPLPPDYDLNDDGEINSADLAILQATIVYDSALRKAVNEGRATSTVYVSPLIGPCINSSRAKPKNCNYNGDFETLSRRRLDGSRIIMRVIDSRDAALLVSSVAYVSGTAPATISSAGAPIVISPLTNTHWISGAPQNVVIQTVPGAKGYLVGFVRNNGTMIFENYRDNGGMNGICTIADIKACVSTGASQTYTIPSVFASKFTSGPLNLIVRALVDNQWTEAAVVPIVID